MNNTEPKYIELKDVYDEQRRNWIKNEQMQDKDHRAATFLAAVILGILFGFVLMMMSACQMSVRVDPIRFAPYDAIDGGQEPLGWEDGDALERELNK